MTNTETTDASWDALTERERHEAWEDHMDAYDREVALREGVSPWAGEP